MLHLVSCDLRSIEVQADEPVYSGQSIRKVSEDGAVPAADLADGMKSTLLKFCFQAVQRDPMRAVEQLLFQARTSGVIDEITRTAHPELMMLPGQSIEAACFAIADGKHRERQLFKPVTRRQAGLESCYEIRMKAQHDGAK